MTSEAGKPALLHIDRLGHKGDGIAPGPIFVPYALPGETIDAMVEGERGRLIAIRTPSPHRCEPFCPHFTECGGCATQHLDQETYQGWKRSLVVDALAQARVPADVAPLVDAHGDGRRRATFHARKGLFGFARFRSHALVDLDTCPLLTPGLNAALPACRALVGVLRTRDKPLDLLVTQTITGIDIDIRGSGPITETLRLTLAGLARKHDLARLSNHGDVILEARAPLVRFGKAETIPPPGAFLQATTAADTILAGLVAEGLGSAKRVLDLFSGCGTFALALADRVPVHAVDSDKPAIAALDKAARRTQGLKTVTTLVRDLFERPYLPDELKPFDAVVFDPPRAGAEAQAKKLAASSIRRIIAVSCNPATFARDAAILIAGGYRMGIVTPVDQFRHAGHVELVASFTR
jgi:23S rRNA (uracil1939-C5)-methyltransferase